MTPANMHLLVHEACEPHIKALSTSISLDLPTQPNPTHNQDTREYKRQRRNRHRPIIRTPPTNLKPHTPSSNRLDARVQKERIRHQHAQARQPPDAVVVYESQHHPFNEREMQPAADQLRVDEFRRRVDCCQRVSGHATGVDRRRECEHEKPADRAQGLDVEQQESPEPWDGR